jgi:peptidoglycan hydrolase CwlO-like protein
MKTKRQIKAGIEQRLFWLNGKVEELKWQADTSPKDFNSIENILELTEDIAILKTQLKELSGVIEIPAFNFKPIDWESEV